MNETPESSPSFRFDSPARFGGSWANGSIVKDIVEYIWDFLFCFGAENKHEGETEETKQQTTDCNTAKSMCCTVPDTAPVLNSGLTGSTHGRNTGRGGSTPSLPGRRSSFESQGWLCACAVRFADQQINVRVGGGREKGTRRCKLPSYCMYLGKVLVCLGGGAGCAVPLGDLTNGTIERETTCRELITSRPGCDREAGKPSHPRPNPNERSAGQKAAVTAARGLFLWIP